MNDKSIRLFFLAGFLINIAVLVLTFYLEWFQHLTPCALCLMQRACIGLMAIFCFAIFFKKRRTFIVLLYGAIILGFYFSLRQLWLQSLPPDSEAACLPSLDILVRYFPWKDIVHALMWGTADCRDITWYLWGLSLPAWSFIYFLIFFVLVSGFFFYEYIRKKFAF